MTDYFTYRIKMGDGTIREIITDADGKSVMGAIERGEGVPNGEARINTYEKGRIDDSIHR